MFQYPCGISPCHTMRRHILCHYGIGGDNSTVANGNPWKNRRLVAYPHIIADDNGTLRGDRALSRRHQEAISISLAMRVVGDCHPFARQAIIANCHFVSASNMVIGTKTAMATNPQERFYIYPPSLRHAVRNKSLPNPLLSPTWMHSGQCNIAIFEKKTFRPHSAILAAAHSERTTWHFKPIIDHRFQCHERDRLRIMLYTICFIFPVTLHNKSTIAEVYSRDYVSPMHVGESALSMISFFPCRWPTPQWHWPAAKDH